MASDDFRIISSNSRVSENLKEVYPALLNNSFAPGFEFLASIPRNKKMPEGEAIHKGIRLQGMGGFSPSAIGESSDYKIVQTNYNLKDFFRKIRLDAVTVDRSKSSQEAFEDYMKAVLKEENIDILWNQSRMLFGDASGKIGTISAVSTAGSVHTCTLSDFLRAKLQEGALVEVVTSSTEHDALFKITDVDFDNSTVDLTLIDGSYTPLASDVIHIQNSYSAAANNEWTGLSKILSATSGTLFGVTVGSGWQSHALDASSATINTDLLRQAYYTLKETEREVPDCIVLHPVQMQLLERELEGKLTDTLLTIGAGKRTFELSVRAVRIGTDLIPLMVENYMPKSEVWFLNRKRMVIESAGDGKMIPGTEGMLHYMGFINGRHEYAMQYHQRSEFFCEPRFHLRLHTLNSTL